MKRRWLRPGITTRFIGAIGGGAAGILFPSDGLVAYWKLDETSNGTTQIDRLDATGNGHAAVDVTKASSTAGIVGNGVLLAYQFLSVPDHADLRCGDRDFTVSCWVKMTSNESMVFLSKWDGNISKREFNIQYNSSDGKFYFYVSIDGGSNYGICTINNALINTWYLIIAWHDSVNNQIGLQANGGTPNIVAHTTGVYSGTVPMGIGGLVRANGTEATLTTRGIVDEVARWNRVLTPDERVRLYSGGAGFQYPFDFYASMEIGSFIYSSSIGA